MSGSAISWQNWLAALRDDPARRVFAAERAITKDGLGFAHDCDLADLVHNAKIRLWCGELGEVERLLDEISKRIGREV
jgi:hypothetical protein